MALRGDAADELLKRVMGGELEALELWYKTRAWVFAGQRKTLARLGVAFDRVFFESDFLADAAELTAAGLRDGRLRRREDGRRGSTPPACGTSRSSSLVRADGLPTQHMRSLAYWMAAPELAGTTSMQVCGTEWVSHVTCRRKLMDELLPVGNGDPGGSNGQAPMHPTRDVFNGMVSRQKRALASSEGALLIDELLEWLDARIDESPERRAVRHGHPCSGTDRGADLARVLPHLPGRPADRLRPRRAAARRRVPRVGPGSGARPPQRPGPVRRPPFGGPRLLASRSSGSRALPALPAPGGAALRRRPARALPQAPRALVPGAGTLRTGRAGRPDAA